MNSFDTITKCTLCSIGTFDFGSVFFLVGSIKKTEHQIIMNFCFTIKITSSDRLLQQQQQKPIHNTNIRNADISYESKTILTYQFNGYNVCFTEIFIYIYKWPRASTSTQANTNDVHTIFAYPCIPNQMISESHTMIARAQEHLPNAIG